MFGDLIRVRGATMDWPLHKSISQRAAPLLAFRDLLAHAIWGQHGHEWLIQKTKGKWPKELESIITGPRKVIPESLPVTVEDLRAKVAEIDALIEDLRALRASATEPKPSQSKPD